MRSRRRRTAIGWQCSADDLDVARFEQAVAGRAQLLALGDADGQRTCSARRWRCGAAGRLPTPSAGSRAGSRRSGSSRCRLDAEELRVDACLRSGQFREVLAEAQAMVARQPLRERRWGLLARPSIRRAARVRRCARCARRGSVLATELGIDPGAELVELEQAILRQDGALVAGHRAGRGERGVSVSGSGVRSMSTTPTPSSVVTARSTSACRRLLATGVLVVVGASGSGKSSLVRRRRRRQRWSRDGRRVVVVTPAPTDRRAHRASDDDDAVLVVDQCEEAVSLCADPTEQAPVLQRPRRVGRAVGRSSWRYAPIGSPTSLSLPGVCPTRRARACTCSVRWARSTCGRRSKDRPATPGCSSSRGLVDLLVREVEGEPGALPLLSHALRQTWQRREGRTLTVDGYRAGGGIRGAVARVRRGGVRGTAAGTAAAAAGHPAAPRHPDADGEPVRVRVPRQQPGRSTPTERS